MNRAILIGIGVIILIIIGWIVFFPPQMSVDNTQTPVGNATIPTTTTTNSTSNQNSSPNTYSKIVLQGGNTECTYEQVSTSTRSTNVIYIADGRLRGEFRTTGITGNLMIYDGTYLYTWKEGTAVGTKTPLTSLAQLPSVIPKDLTSGASFGSSLDSVGWDCHAWSKDPTMLVPPPEIKFTLQ